MSTKCKYPGCNVSPRGKNKTRGLCSKHQHSSVNAKVPVITVPEVAKPNFKTLPEPINMDRIVWDNEDVIQEIAFETASDNDYYHIGKLEDAKIEIFEQTKKIVQTETGLALGIEVEVNYEREYEGRPFGMYEDTIAIPIGQLKVGRNKDPWEGIVVSCYHCEGPVSASSLSNKWNTECSHCGGILEGEPEDFIEFEDLTGEWSEDIDGT